MFRISFYVDDKNLGEAFKRLAGLAKNVEHAYVPNVETKPNGKLASKGDAIDMLITELRLRKVTEINAAVARSVIADLGFSPKAYGYYLQKAMAQGLLTKHKGPGGNKDVTYTVKGAK